jgi:hypothetical protein
VIGDELFDFARSVNSRDDFIKFVGYLVLNFQQEPSAWQNNTLEQFLNGLAGFSNDMGGFYTNMGDKVDIEQITWRMAAEMLLAATVYGN